MASRHLRNATTGSFQRWVEKTPPEELGEARFHRCLMDYIEAWVTSGEGIRACASDYQTYLTAVIVIIQMWTRDPSVLQHLTDDEVPVVTPRHVDSILGSAGMPNGLDPYWFARQVFNFCHPYAPES